MGNSPLCPKMDSPWSGFLRNCETTGKLSPRLCGSVGKPLTSHPRSSERTLSLWQLQCQQSQNIISCHPAIDPRVAAVGSRTGYVPAVDGATENGAPKTLKEWYGE